MLSGNGRHRRPRQAPALLVAAGVTGSAIAIPLLGAASANAADGTTWDKVAECESGGSWSANTGNGYYGGLQISQDDWAKYGGTRYASSPDQASRSQQIAVAEKILADKGTTPWATCALLSGLTANSGSVDVDTGVGGSGGTGGTGDSSGSTDGSGSSGSSDAGTPSDPTTGSTGSADSTGSPSGSGSGTDSGTGSGGAGSSGPSTSTQDPASTPSSGTGKDSGAHHGKAHGSTPSGTPKPGTSAPTGSQNPKESDTSTPDTPEADDPDPTQQSAGSWSLVDTGSLSSGGRHRGDSADENVTNGQNDAASGRHASRRPDTYTVRAGDSLTSIADSLGVDGGWHALYAENQKSIGSDPNDISAGQTLKVGTETGVN
ncbi:transglycosylase family protein [Streptomyces sp. NPDC001606]